MVGIASMPSFARTSDVLTRACASSEEAGSRSKSSMTGRISRRCARPFGSSPEYAQPCQPRARNQWGETCIQGRSAEPVAGKCALMPMAQRRCLVEAGAVTSEGQGAQRRREHPRRRSSQRSNGERFCWTLTDHPESVRLMASTPPAARSPLDAAPEPPPRAEPSPDGGARAPASASPRSRSLSLRRSAATRTGGRGHQHRSSPARKALQRARTPACPVGVSRSHAKADAFSPLPSRASEVSVGIMQR